MSALAVTAVALVVVTLAALRTSREIPPTLRSVERLRGDLQPALVRVRTERDRAARLTDRG